MKSYLDMLRVMQAERAQRWAALGAWGRFKFRVRDALAIVRHRAAAAWEILRHGNDDEYYKRPQP